MSQLKSTVGAAGARAGNAVEETAASPWAVMLARFGLAAKGIVYIVVGVLAVQVALGSGGRMTNKSGALQTILDQPFGKVMLGAVAVGLFGYVLWRFVQALTDPERKGTGAKGLGIRAGYILSGIVYAGLALAAVRGVMSATGDAGGGGDQTKSWTGWLLSQPFGAWLVGIIGASIIGVGLFQFYKAYSAKFREKFNLHEMSTTEDLWATRLGRFGLAARGVVFGIVGFFLIQAARTFDPNQARGLDGALRTLLQQSYGTILMGVVAAGLVAYGVYMLVEARYRRIRPA
ncbi:MAG TPA: DUF1206 domain-containing protein [Pyrinomonadaceae bacterium]|nr:DUF1206 domain-containing protein [Pyrinomonadaceae bacterium]